MNINFSNLLPPIRSIQPEPVTPPATNAPENATAFRDMLSSVINQVESSQADANRAVDQFLAGEGDDLHSTILATQRADLEFQMFMQARNKVVNAYQEIMKMQM
jgi:flagellar hook-basal body complex protein FliE